MTLIDKIKDAGRKAIYPVILGTSLALCPITNPQNVSAETKASIQTSPTTEIYLKGGIRSLNPKKYNNEIKKVSYGKGFGDVPTVGAGYTQKLSPHLALGLEADYNIQSADAIREVAATGKRESYGKNELQIVSVNMPFCIDVNLFGKTELDFSLSPELEIVKLSSSNSQRQTSSSHYLLSARAGVELNQNLGQFLISIGAFYHAIPEYDNILDISGLETAIKLGAKFK